MIKDISIPLLQPSEIKFILIDKEGKLYLFTDWSAINFIEDTKKKKPKRKKK